MWPFIQAYQDARFGLANCLWESGQHHESIDHLQNLLLSYPDDQEGVRYVLASYLLELGDMKALKKLLSQYPDDYYWLFTKALVSFREHGGSPGSCKFLQKAEKSNPCVIPYLTGRLKLPHPLPKQIIDDRSEAIYFAVEYGPHWVNTPGALEWLNVLYPDKPGKPKAKIDTNGVPKVFLQALDGESPRLANTVQTETIYTFKVGLQGEPELWRKIEIQGNQTLDDLHYVIYQAFERDDPHLYSFFMNNKAWDYTAEYGPQFRENRARDSTQVRIDSLGLRIKSKFLYIFDFGDEWKHPITLLSIQEESPKGYYPRIVDSQGKAPPQYPDDEVDEEE
jgi:hypothetical protein